MIRRKTKYCKGCKKNFRPAVDYRKHKCPKCVINDRFFNSAFGRMLQNEMKRSEFHLSAIWHNTQRDLELLCERFMWYQKAKGGHMKDGKVAFVHDLNRCHLYPVKTDENKGGIIHVENFVWFQAHLNKSLGNKVYDVGIYEQLECKTNLQGFKDYMRHHYDLMSIVDRFQLKARSTVKNKDSDITTRPRACMSIKAIIEMNYDEHNQYLNPKQKAREQQLDMLKGNTRSTLEYH